MTVLLDRCAASSGMCLPYIYPAFFKILCLMDKSFIILICKYAVYMVMSTELQSLPTMLISVDHKVSVPTEKTTKPLKCSRCRKFTDLFTEYKHDYKVCPKCVDLDISDGVKFNLITPKPTKGSFLLNGGMSV